MKLEKIIKKSFSIFVFFFCTQFFSQVDSIPNKSHFLIHINAGYTIFNKFNLDQYPNSPYWVNSKLKPMYIAGFEYYYQRINIGLSAAYIQHEFYGKDFEYNIFDQNGHNSPVSIAKYNLYQKLNSKIFQVSLSFGININIAAKHILFTNLYVASNLFYKNKVSNYYSTDQYGFDTTKYSLLKDVETSQNAGKFPAIGIIVAYNYKISPRLFIDFKVNLQFFHTNYENDPYNNSANGKIKGIPDTRDAYLIRNNIFITPLIGIKYRLF